MKRRLRKRKRRSTTTTRKTAKNQVHIFQNKKKMGENNQDPIVASRFYWLWGVQPWWLAWFLLVCGCQRTIKGIWTLSSSTGLHLESPQLFSTSHLPPLIKDGCPSCGSSSLKCYRFLAYMAFQMKGAIQKLVERSSMIYDTMCIASLPVSRFILLKLCLGFEHWCCGKSSVAQHCELCCETLFPSSLSYWMMPLFFPRRSPSHLLLLRHIYLSSPTTSLCLWHN